MNSFFRKAIGLFVILDDEEPKKKANPSPKKEESGKPKPNPRPRPTMKEADISKFEKHFQELFDKANLPGPDYYEFLENDGYA